MVWAICLGLSGLFLVGKGIKTLFTGQLSAKEEAKLEGFSKKGSKIFRLWNAIFAIISGLAVVGIGILRYLENEKIIDSGLVYYLVVLGFAVVMVVALAVIQKKCKNMTDDE